MYLYLYLNFVFERCIWTLYFNAANMCFYIFISIILACCRVFAFVFVLYIVFVFVFAFQIQFVAEHWGWTLRSGRYKCNSLYCPFRLLLGRYWQTIFPPMKLKKIRHQTELHQLFQEMWWKFQIVLKKQKCGSGWYGFQCFRFKTSYFKTSQCICPNAPDLWKYILILLIYSYKV